MKYRNAKTQAVIETACEIKGGNWVKVEEKQPGKSMETQKKKTARKKSGE